MNEHSPSSWHADGLTVRCTNGIVAKAILPQHGGCFAAMDNAALMAAAPDLLEAAEMAVEVLQVPYDLTDKLDIEKCIGKLATAITKAKGVKL